MKHTLEEEGQIVNMTSYCHRTQGFGSYVDHQTRQFYNYFCNDLVFGNALFRNSKTNFQWIKYKDCRAINDYYNSWNIRGLKGDGDLYWKYITYQVTKNLHHIFLMQKRPDRSDWGKISKTEATKTINSLLHLNGNMIACNEDEFHYIKTL